MSSFLVESVSLTKSADMFALLKVLLWARPMHEALTLVLLALNSKALMDCISTLFSQSKQVYHRILPDSLKLPLASSPPFKEFQGSYRTLKDPN
jgi:hypothetical protein